MKRLKELKSYFSGAYSFLKTILSEDIEKILEEEREREICLLKETYAKFYNKQNQKYNVFVYDTILYPPDSTSQPKRN